MKTRKIFSRVLLYLLTILTFGLLIRAFFNYRMGNKLEEYIGDRQTEGVALSRKALMPECSEADNGANLWKAAEALFLREGVNVNTLRDTMDAFFYGKSLGSDVRKELEIMIANNPRVFQFMEEASEKPCFRYGDWSQNLYDMKIPDAVKMINAIRLLGIDAVFKAEKGHVHEAIDQIRWTKLLVKKTLDEPLLITGLIALANMKYLQTCFMRIINGRDLDSDTLRMNIQDLYPERWREKFVRGIHGERVFLLENALAVLEGNMDALGYNLGDRIFFWIMRPATKADVLWAQKMFDKVEAATLLPYYEIKESHKDITKDIESIPWSFRLSGGLFPNFTSAWLKEAIMEAFMGTGQIALACKIYKNQEGHFPENIAELVPGILEKEPLDPFTGDPFIYKLQEDGFIVYSVGSNEKDDDGRATYQVTKLVMEKDDDWPWRERTK
ncbi:MAG: hypothetical protein JSV17_15210 [Candidatus Aminicenantes bacterium]|nr:MAG: hypothetical protein JSV17_15210 [Candidatus Aminicenantes bacterium]